MSRPAVLFIVGPTASGKTSLAFGLAKRLDGEILSADSMLIYKGMDIGTAKPSPAELKKIPHHGINLVPPSKNFSVFEYREYALKAIRDIVSRGKLPIVAGGTGFYVRALLEGLTPHPGQDPEIRRKLSREAVLRGPEVLYRRLLKIDPKRAKAIGPHNVRRIVRALEIYLVSKRKPSAPVPKSPGLRALGFRPKVIGLNRDRAALYDAIARRVDSMFRKGLVAEVKRLSRKKISSTARQGVGYKEVMEALRRSKNGRVPREVKENIKKTTRHFAKRQWTWFKREKGIRWVWWPETASLRTVRDFILNMVKNEI